MHDDAEMYIRSGKQVFGAVRAELKVQATTVSKVPSSKAISGQITYEGLIKILLPNITYVQPKLSFESLSKHGVG